MSDEKPPFIVMFCPWCGLIAKTSQSYVRPADIHYCPAQNNLPSFLDEIYPNHVTAEERLRKS